MVASAKQNDGFVPIRQAAKLVHRSRHKVRDLVDRRLVRARQIGKTKQGDPWLAVHLGQLIEALEREEVYVPRASQKSRLRSYRSSSVGLHPSAAAI